MELNKNTRKWILILVAITLGMIWVMQRLALIPQFISGLVAFFSPLLIGVMIAFVVNLPMRWLERCVFSKIFKGKSKKGRNPSRLLSMLASFLLVLGVISAVIFMLVPDLIRTLVTFAQQLQPAFRNFQTWLDKVGTSDSPFSSFLKSSNLSINDLIMRVTNWINNTVTEILSSAFGWLTNLLNGFLNFFIGFVLSIYFLMQKERLGRQIKQMAYAALPELFVDRVLQLGKLINTVFSRFLGGQGLEAVILGTLVFIFMNIFRFPYPLTISVLVAVGALIPVFGATIAGVLGAMLILVDSPIQALWFMIMLVSIQQVEGNFIYPRVVGKSVGLPSIWVLIAVTFGSKLFGFFGLLLGVPMFSVIYILMRAWSLRRVEEKNIPQEKLEFVTMAHEPEEELGIAEEAAAEAAGRSVFKERRLRRAAAAAEEDETLIDQVSADWQTATSEIQELSEHKEDFAQGNKNPASAAPEAEVAPYGREPVKPAASPRRPEPVYGEPAYCGNGTREKEPRFANAGAAPAPESPEAERRRMRAEAEAAAARRAGEAVRPVRAENKAAGRRAAEEDQAPGVRKFKASFDLDRLEEELEREAQEAAEIRRRAWRGRRKEQPDEPGQDPRRER